MVALGVLVSIVIQEDVSILRILPQGNTYARLCVMPYAFGDSIQCTSILIPCQSCGLDKKIIGESELKRAV